MVWHVVPEQESLSWLGYRGTLHHHTGLVPQLGRKPSEEQLVDGSIITEQGLDLGSVWKVCDHGNVKAYNVSGLKKAMAHAVNLHNHDHPPTLFLSFRPRTG